MAEKQIDRSDLYVTMNRDDQIYRTIRTAIKSAACVLGAYAVMTNLEPFAGKETTLTFIASFLANMKVAISFALTGAAVAWAVVERTLRHRKVEKMQQRIRDLELMVDPKRSSSRLTKKGKTNPADLER